MSSAILAGATIGYFIYVLIDELEIEKVCRVCGVFWVSLICVVLLRDIWALGIINLVAHATYKALKVVCHDPTPPDEMLHSREIE